MMSSSFTVMWNGDRVRSAKPLAGKPVPFLAGGPHVSQPLFSRAGVREGDCVYPIFVRQKTLHVLARVVVKNFVEIDQFISSRKDLFPAHLRGSGQLETLDRTSSVMPWLKAFWWTCANEMLLPETSTAISLTTTLPVASLERLTYVSKKGSRGVRGLKDGQLTSVISLQGVYRLSSDSAADFAAAVEQPTGTIHGDILKLEA